MHNPLPPKDFEFFSQLIYKQVGTENYSGEARKEEEEEEEEEEEVKAHKDIQREKREFTQRKEIPVCR